MSTPATILAGCLVALALAGTARAHEGPPYPIAVDEPAGPYTISVWTDPDVGTGTFYVIFDPPAYRSAEDPRVSVEVWPRVERLPPARHDSIERDEETYTVEVPFDSEETWHVVVHVEGSRGSGTLERDVEVTPPGYGRWDLLIYLGPFLFLGGAWVLILFRRRSYLAEQAALAAEER